jgi:hypothetical protein
MQAIFCKTLEVMRQMRLVGEPGFIGNLGVRLAVSGNNSNSL